MKATQISVRLHYNGQFQKSAYVSGQTLGVARVDVDTFSYTVLMEYVKDYLHYTEIGGVYSLKGKGGWKLLTNDKDLLEIVEECENGGEIHVFLDNTVDKEIEPLNNQMQPHVIIRPRKNIIQGSAKKPLKRAYVSTHQLQQQRKMSKRSPVEGKRNNSSPAPNLLKDKGTPSVRRKLELQNTLSHGETTGENDVAAQNPPITAYEQDRVKRIKQNKEVMKSYGIVPIVAAMAKHGVQNSKGQNKDQENPEEDEYDPEKEQEIDSEDTLERMKIFNAKMKLDGPRTRSRAKTQAPVEQERESTHANTATRKESRQAGIVNEKEVTSSYRAPVIKPTCSKIFKKSINGEDIGNMNTYLAYRKLQKENIAAPTPQEEEAIDEEAIDEVVKVAAPRKPRVRTKMTNVHARSSDEKVVITLNADGQPISENPKILTELSNFLGTLAKDNVSLTYINWHVVPEKLKSYMWKKTLDKYVIPDEGEKWVRKTLNDAWRVHKCRMKGKYYNSFETDEERYEHRDKTEEIPLEDFTVLLKYWGDDVVQKLASDNSARRNLFTDTHTMGPRTHAHFKEKLKKNNPEHGSPSSAKLYLESRKREPGRVYKTKIDAQEKKMAEIKKLLSSGKDAEADAMVTQDKDHGRNFLVGRRGKSYRSTSAPTDNYVQDLKAKIKLDLERELEAKVNKKVQENMAWMLKKLGDANPDLKVNITDFCTAMSIEDGNGTPMTETNTPVTQGGSAIP